MKYEIPEMLKQNRGSVVNTSSVAGLIGSPGNSPYAAAKHGVVGITKVAALEFAEAGIRINAVCPAVVRTPMLDRALGENPKLLKVWETSHPMGSIAEPEEVAEAVIWLCSDKASFITGQALAIDGGLTAK